MIQPYQREIYKGNKALPKGNIIIKEELIFIHKARQTLTAFKDNIILHG